MAEVFKFKTKRDAQWDDCVQRLEQALAKVRKRETTGVAIVTLHPNSGLGTGYLCDDVIALLGGLTRLIADINKDMDDNESK